LGGYLLQAVDVRLVLVLLGAGYVITLVAFLFHPALRTMNVRQGVPTEIEAAPSQ
jgi:hypothetical protein